MISKKTLVIGLLLLGMGTFVISCGSSNSPTSSSNPTATPTTAFTATSTPTANVTVIANFGASSAPYYLHFDQSGNLYAALYNGASVPCTVGKIASPGGASPVTSTAYTGTAAAYLNAAVADNNGNLWIANEYPQVIEIPNGGGTPVTISTGFNSSSQIWDLAINNAGNTLYLADESYGYVYALNLSNPSAGATTIVNSSTVNPAYFDQGLAFDGSGNLFLGGYYYRVGEITAANLNSSAVPVTIAGNGTNGAANGTATGTAEFGQVFGVAADSNGNVYAADYTNTAIRKISGGNVTTLIAASGSALSPSMSPSSLSSGNTLYGVACDAAGNVYFSDYSNGNIYRYQP